MSSYFIAVTSAAVRKAKGRRCGMALDGGGGGIAHKGSYVHRSLRSFHCNNKRVISEEEGGVQMPYSIAAVAAAPAKRFKLFGFLVEGI